MLAKPEPAPLHRQARALMARLWPYFGHARSAWALAAVTTVLASATEPMIPALLKPLLDRGFQAERSVALWHVPALLLLVFGLRAVATFLSQYSLALVIQSGLQRLRDALFAKLLSARLGLFDEQNASTLANTVVYEVQNGSALLINALVRLLRDGLTLLALLGYLVYLNWKLTLVVALILPPLMAVVRSLSKRMYRLSQQSQTATDELAYVVEENVLAHRDIRLHAAQAGQASRFGKLSRGLRQLSMKSTVAAAGMSALTHILSALALSAVIAVAMVQSADGSTTVGGFVAFITAMLMLIAPLKGLADAAQPITRGIAAMERGLSLMDQVLDERGGSFSVARATGELKLSSVSLHYGAGGRESPALDRISLHIRPGESVALVGSSGSGKTSLVNLLPRFLDCSSGHVELDGVDLKDWDLAALRAQFAYVSQHVVMLKDSLAANVALGQTPDLVQVRLALEAANLGPWVQELPQGLDTVLGHNAMQLSGGQRQRLAIARAIYKNAPVLILDEATSALDTESEQAVQQALERLRQGRTSVVIAHRLSTIRHADRIIVLEAGQVREQGTHEALLALGGAYSHLHHMGLRSTESAKVQHEQALS
jgi:ATP-binding cassette, subfamily B, bacterial MsbA